MKDVFSFIHAHWGTISVVGLLIIKWVYNAWPEGGRFSFRSFLGEIIQEAPTKPVPPVVIHG